MENFALNIAIITIFRNMIHDRMLVALPGGLRFVWNGLKKNMNKSDVGEPDDDLLILIDTLIDYIEKRRDVTLPCLMIDDLFDSLKVTEKDIKKMVVFEKMIRGEPLIEVTLED